jgi:hypothetical protein
LGHALPNFQLLSQIYIISERALVTERADAGFVSCLCAPYIASHVADKFRDWVGNAADVGIPKFYRWLSERYPLINQPIGASAVPEIDNLYLDMNGIIHNCTHGNDPSTKLTRKEMLHLIFNYLNRLVQIIKPQQLLFMAIDGM